MGKHGNPDLGCVRFATKSKLANLADLSCNAERGPLIQGIRSFVVGIHICTFYRFLPLTHLEDIQHQLEYLAQHGDIRGLVLIGEEGINATVSGSESAIALFKLEVLKLLGLSELNFKDSVGSKHPFLVFKVKIKREIVSLGKPELVPDAPANNHLSPAEWRKALRDPHTLVLDTRNSYEVEIGKFKNAVDFQLAEFNEFPVKLKQAGIAKDQQVLMYCTGGIRCEKAILEMREQGYKKVYQLDGGILNYLKEFPHEDFQGECFVFDYRVAVDQDLQPTVQYKLCPHCGQPADKPVACVKCGRAETLCGNCHSSGVVACSKNCAHHMAIGSSSSKVHLPELKKRYRS